MKIVNMTILCIVAVSFSIPAKAQIDLPFNLYGDKTSILYPVSWSDSLIYAANKNVGYNTAVSRDGSIYALPENSTGGAIYIASYPYMMLHELLRIKNISWDYPTEGIYNLIFHPDNEHIIFETKIYDEQRGGEYIVTENETSISNGLSTICMVNTQNSENEVLIEGGIPRAISPDGRYLLYMVHDYRIFILPDAAIHNFKWAMYDFQTGESVFLYEALGGEETIDRYHTSSIIFSPDGSSLYYLTSGDDGYSSHQLYKKTTGNLFATQLSNFVYPEDADISEKVILKSISISNDEKWAVITGKIAYGKNYLMMYEIESGRIFSLFTGEEISSDFREMIAYQKHIIETFGDPDDDGVYYDENMIGTAGNNVYSINGIVYNYSTFHLVDPCFVGWHPDSETMLINGCEIGGSGIYHMSSDPMFYLDPVTIVETDTPDAFPTVINYPNPFNPRTTLSFTLPDGGYTELGVYNLAGQQIRELINGDLAPGTYDVVWDGRDDSGKLLSSGVFVSQLKTGDTVVTNRMTLVK